MDLVDALARNVPAIARLGSPALRQAVLETWAASLERSPYESIERSPQAPHMPTRSLLKHVNEVNARAIDLSGIASKEYGLVHDFDRALRALRVERLRGDSVGRRDDPRQHATRSEGIAVIGALGGEAGCSTAG